jgi:hypothetical protein
MTGRSAPLFSLRARARAGKCSFALAALLLLAVAACGAPTSVVRSFAPGEPFWLALGQSAVGDDGGTAVRFAKVVGDSRCPPQAVCVWQGEVNVDLGVRVGGVEELIVRLNTETPPKSVTVQGRLIELLAVEGGRGAGIGPTDPYRAQLRVTFVR